MFYEFHNCHQYVWKSSAGLGQSKGIGKIRLSLIMDDGRLWDVTMACAYAEKLTYNLMSACKSRRDTGIAYNDGIQALYDTQNVRNLPGKWVFDVKSDP